MNEKELVNVFDTLLSVPGMNDVVRIDLKLPRKTVLFLAQILERGLEASQDEKGSAWAHVVDEQQAGVLRTVATDVLQKASLTELNEKLKKLC